MRIQTQKRRSGVSFLGLLAVGVILTMMMLILIRLERNVPYTPKPSSFGILPVEKSDRTGAKKSASVLMVCEDDPMGEAARTMMSSVLDQIKVAYDTAECREITPDRFGAYDTLLLGVTHYRYLADVIPALRSWVRGGGNLMVLYPPEADGSFMTMSNLFGIQDAGDSFELVSGISFGENFMLGAKDRVFRITDPYDSSMSVSLESDCEVFARSDGEYPVPIIWRRRAGAGTIVFDNLGFLEKAYRGIHCAAYSLLGDYSLYPVINASVFYIDDFPSPVPGGSGVYVQRDYDMSIREFYTSVWWRDVYNLARKHGIRYTGMIIENYNDVTEGPFTRNPDTERYIYFGNMLLEQGGEIGLHGYNHMPLVTEDFDYEGLFDSYVRWPSQEEMRAATREVRAFARTLFPYSSVQCYVPPSNIISREGLEVLRDEGITSVASVYLPGELAYSQEFEVGEDGIIQTPRVISGYMLDDFSQLAAFSELNFHLVSSHFQHPDDVLDEERGAAMGWAELFSRLSAFADWLYSAVPSIRNLTGTEFAGAVQRYDAVDLVHYKTGDGIEADLTNFYDEAWFMLRDNRGRTVESVEGGSFTLLEDGQILIKAEQPHVSIRFAQ